MASQDPKQHDPQPSTRESKLTPIRKYFLSPLEPNVSAELQLLILTFSTGIQDAISFPDFLCFASNQTGNTVVLAVGLSGFQGDFFHLPNVGVSLATFLAGAVIFGQFGNLIGPRRRLWQIVSNIIQTLMVFGAAWIQFSQGLQQKGPSALGAIALLAFSSGAQVATARAFKMTEISTAMATAAWVDLVIDPKLFAMRNRSRNRRALFLVALAAGSFAGAYMHSSIGSALALCMSAVGKTVVIAMLFVSRSDPEHNGGVISSEISKV